MIGFRRKFLTAWITVDTYIFKAFADEKGSAIGNLNDLLKNKAEIDNVHSVVEEKNAELACFESIKDFRLLDEFSIENGLLTPTLKVKRNVAMERFSDVIEEMYREG